MTINHLPYRPCVGLVLINKKGLVFAAKRIDAPSEAWQMPQGGIDDGEAPKEAALRELCEETGIAADLVDIIDETPYWLRYDLPEALVPELWGGCYRGQRQKWFALRFKGEDRDIDIAQETPEFSEWKWMKSRDVIASIVEFKRDVYQQVLGEFKAHMSAA